METMKTIKPQKLHKNIRKDILAIVHKHTPEGGTAEIVLAIASQVVGQLLAMQDQRKYTVNQIAELIQTNIEAGNQQFVADLMRADGLTPPYIQ